MPFALHRAVGRRATVRPGRPVRRGAGLPAGRRRAAHHADRRPCARHRSRAGGRRGRASWRFLYVMLLVGMVASALVFGALLADFSADPPDPGDPGRRAGDDGAQHGRAVEAGGAQPGAHRGRRARGPPSAKSWRAFRARAGSRAASSWLSGSAPPAFSMQDILLEPYGGEILQPQRRRRPRRSPRFLRSRDARRASRSPRARSGAAAIPIGSPASARWSGCSRFRP